MAIKNTQQIKSEFCAKIINPASLPNTFFNDLDFAAQRTRCSIKSFLELNAEV